MHKSAIVDCFMTYKEISVLILLLKFVVFFLDISKAFDKVWHEGLSGIESFLKNRFQRVNGQSSNWLPVKASVSHGPTTLPLFFRYIFTIYQKDNLNNQTFCR